MKIGLTYDLRAEYLAQGYSEEETAEFDRGETIHAIDAALRSLGYQTDRIGNARQLMARLLAGDRWDLVFNIAEGLRGYGREAQVPAILDVFGVPYTFAEPLNAALTLHKGLTKRVLRDLGVPTTDFALVRCAADLADVHLPFPLFVKPVAEGTAKGIDGRSRVTTPAELADACQRTLERFRQPALVEPFLPGREFTVGIVGSGNDAVAVGTMEIELLDSAEPHSYTYLNKEECETLCRYTVAPREWAEPAERVSLAAWRGLECRDGGRVDLRAGPDDCLYVMEINPLPGLHPNHSDLPMIATAAGWTFPELIGRIVQSALRRAAAEPAARPALAVAGA